MLAVGLGLWGCQWRESDRVVVYTTLDTALVEPIFRRFTEKTGMEVVCLGPEEAKEEAGRQEGRKELRQAVVDERGRPICDLVWHAEPVQMARLRQENLLAAYHWPDTLLFNPWAKSPDGRWHGLAARARVLLLYSPAFQDQPPDRLPGSILDLTSAKYRGKAAMAGRQSDTAVAHLACLFALWGPQRCQEYLRQLRENEVRFLETEAEVARQVAEGRCLLGLTDSDQAIRHVEQGSPVLLVYPDQREDQPGCLFLPTTIAILRRAQHPTAARQLAKYLLDPEVETRLTHGPHALVPLNHEVTAFSRIRRPGDIKAMKVDFVSAAGYWEAAVVAVQ